MKKYVALISVCSFLIFSCEPKKEQKQEPTNTNVAEKSKVQMEIDQLLDSVNTVWNAMILSDDEKFLSIKRLLEEISYTKKYNVLKQQELLNQLPAIKAKRYTQETLSDSSITAYDAATDTLISHVFKLSAATPDLSNHTIAAELIEEINAANGNELIQYRVKYDRWAKELNAYIKNNKEELEKLGEPYKSLKELSLFESSPVN